MINCTNAPLSARSLSHEKLLQISRGKTRSKAHQAQAELQRRAVARNILVLSLAVATVLLLIALALSEFTRIFYDFF